MWLAHHTNVKNWDQLLAWAIRVASIIHYAQATESTGDGASTLALKPMGRINQIQNREYQWLHKMVKLSPQIYGYSEINAVCPGYLNPCNSMQIIRESPRILIDLIYSHRLTLPLSYHMGIHEDFLVIYTDLYS